MAHQEQQKGVVTLVTMVVIFIVALSIALSIQYLGVATLEHGFQGNLSEQAFAIADGCGDEAIQRLRMSSSYTGATLTIGDDACTIAVTGSGGTRQIDVSGTVNGLITRKIRIDVSLTTASPRNTLAVTGWQELTN